MKKRTIVFMLLLAIMIPTVSYAETISFSDFDPSVDLTSHYAFKQVLNGKTTYSKKKKDQVYLEYPYGKEPYMYFARFVVDSPADQYSGFMETIYYRDSIKVKDMYYEKNPVKTSKTGIFFTDLCFTSEEGVIYHYKNVPYLVENDAPTIFFKEINYDEESDKLSGEVEMPKLKNTCQIELFYTDQEEYHYQEAVADKKGKFTIELVREGQIGKMYLRASDGLGNYADACDILKSGNVEFDNVTKVSHKKNPQKIKSKSKSFSVVPWLLAGGVGTLIGIFLKLQKWKLNTRSD